MPEFYSPCRHAPPLPKRSAPISIGFHLILPIDYFQQSYQEMLLPGVSPPVGLMLSTPMCFIVIWASRCNVSGFNATRRQWKRGNVRHGHPTRHKGIWYRTIPSHAALFKFVAKGLVENLLGHERNIRAIQLSLIRQPVYVIVKSGNHGNYWHWCHGESRSGLEISYFIYLPLFRFNLKIVSSPISNNGPPQ